MIIRSTVGTIAYYTCKNLPWKERRLIPFSEAIVSISDGSKIAIRGWPPDPRSISKINPNAHRIAIQGRFIRCEKEDNGDTIWYLEPIVHADDKISIWSDLVMEWPRAKIAFIPCDCLIPPPESEITS